MRPIRKISTILGLLILVTGIAVSTFLVQKGKEFLTRAGPETEPSEVKITNLSESGFTVSWITETAVVGSLKYGETSSLELSALDERDILKGKVNQYTTHHVSLTSLKPNKKYYFKIISGKGTYDEKGAPYTLTTLSLLSSGSSLEPAYGTVSKPDGSPAENAIVYLTVKDSPSLSALVKSSGNWLIPLVNLRTNDLASYLSLPEEEILEISIQAGPEGTAFARIESGSRSPVPNIILGKNYNFLAQKQSSPGVTPTITPTPFPSPSPQGESGFSLPLSSSPSATPKFEAISPASGSALIDSQPLFKGKGVPGEKVTITIQSPETLTGMATVDKNGLWSWTPPQNLTPGEHTVTLSSLDNTGKPQTLSYKFTVLASGSSVSEPATPSATPTATVSATLPATPSAVPITADFNPTFWLVFLGIYLLILGGGRFLLTKRFS